MRLYLAALFDRCFYFDPFWFCHCEAQAESPLVYLFFVALRSGRDTTFIYYPIAVSLGQ